MTLDTNLYIEIMVTPGEKYEKYLDTLELCLCNCIELGFKNIVLNFELIKKYDIMFLTPLYELLKSLDEVGAHIIVTQPPLIFINEFEEIYENSSITLIHSRDDIITEQRDIIHTFLENDTNIIITLTQESEKQSQEALNQNEAEQEIENSKRVHIKVLDAEIIDSNSGFSYFDPDKNIDVCTITGEYKCGKCKTKEYFMKGFPFDPCASPQCTGGNTSWMITKKVF